VRPVFYMQAAAQAEFFRGGLRTLPPVQILY